MLYAQPSTNFEAFLHDAPVGLVGTLTYRLIDDDGTVHIPQSTVGITEVLPGLYRRAGMAPAVKGTYLVVWNDGTTTVTEELVVVASLPGQDLAELPPMDLRDVRVLIPRTRRAVEGPDALASGMAGSLSDDAITALIADSIASVIFYSGSLFGHELEVVARDPFYLAPIAWRTGAALTEPEATIIIAQAALDYFLHTLQDMTSEEIVDEGQRWAWARSAQVISGHMDALRKARDRALEELSQSEVVLDGYASFIATRDAAASHAVEPWVWR